MLGVVGVVGVVGGRAGRAGSRPIICLLWAGAGLIAGLFGHETPVATGCDVDAGSIGSTAGRQTRATSIDQPCSCRGEQDSADGEQLPWPGVPGDHGSDLGSWSSSTRPPVPREDASQRVDLHHCGPCKHDEWSPAAGQASDADGSHHGDADDGREQVAALDEGCVAGPGVERPGSGRYQAEQQHGGQEQHPEPDRLPHSLVWLRTPRSRRNR